MHVSLLSAESQPAEASPHISGGAQPRPVPSESSPSSETEGLNGAEVPAEAGDAAQALEALAATLRQPSAVLGAVEGAAWTSATSCVWGALSPRRAQAVEGSLTSLTQEAAALSVWADPGEARLRHAEEQLDAALRKPGWTGWSKHAHAHRLLRRARKRPSAARRVLALWLCLVLLHVKSGLEADAAMSCFWQRDDEDEEPAERAQAAHARLNAQPAGRPAAGPPPSAPTLIPQLMRRGHLQELRRTAAGEGAPPPRAHAMDPQAMYAASPLAPGGASDERSKAQLREQVSELKARVAEGDKGAGLDRDSIEAPMVDGVRLVRAHLATADMCAHCQAGTCSIWEVAALATACPVPFYGGQRPRAGACLVPARGDTYPLPPDERTRQAATAAKLQASHRARLVDELRPALAVSPTFFVYKHRYASSLQWAQERFSTGGRLLEHLNTAWERVQKRAEAEGVTAASVSRALGAESLSDAGRLVYDYTEVNARGCSWPFALCSLDEILMAVPRGGWIASVDIESGFHHVAIAPGDSPYLAFRNLVSGKTYAPTRLMFGMRSAPAAFSTVTAELVASAQRRIWRELGEDCGVRLFVYIDDIFVVGPTREACKSGLDILKSFCVEVNVALKAEKVREPAQDAPVLGLRIDTNRMVVYLPADKRWNILFALHVMIGLLKAGHGVPRSLIQKVTGKLNHFCVVWPLGLAHIGPLYEASQGAQGGLVPRAGADDLLDVLSYFHGVLSKNSSTEALCQALPTSQEAPPGVSSHGDASGDVGCSLSMGPLVLWARWTEQVASPAVSIGMKELHPLIMLLELAGDLLEGFTWFPRMDNLPNAFAILKGHTSDRELRPWLIAFLCMRGKALTISGWEPRLFNAFNDKSSKSRNTSGVLGVMDKYRR